MKKRNVLEFEIENNCDCEFCKALRESMVPELGNSSVFYLGILVNVLECLNRDEMENLKDAILSVRATEENRIVCTHLQIFMENGARLSNFTLEKIEETLNFANFPQLLEVVSLNKGVEYAGVVVANKATERLKDERDVQYNGFCEVLFSSKATPKECEDGGFELTFEEEILATKNKKKYSKEAEKNLDIFIKKLKEFYPDADFEEEEF